MLIYSNSTLVKVWFAGYMSVMAYGTDPYAFAEDALWALSYIPFLIIPLLVLWILTIVSGAGFSVYLFDKKRKFERRLFQFSCRYPQLFEPQCGEKSSRRDKYYRNKQSRKRRKTNRTRSSGKAKDHEPPIYDPQFGIADCKIVESFRKLAKSGNVPIDSSLIDKLENLIALYFSLRDATTTTQMCSIIILYCKTHYRDSLAMKVGEYLTELCEMEYSVQSGPKISDEEKVGRMFDKSFDPQAGEFASYLKDSEKPKWLKLLKECQENWTLVIRNEGFSKISKILSLAIALGLCEASSLDFRVAGMKMFSIGAAAKHASAVDLVDAAFETIVYFAEGGYACFERGSIKPLLYGNMEAEVFEENFGVCQQSFDYAKAGNLDIIGMDDNDYEQLLCRTIERCQEFVNTSRGAVEKNVYRRKLDALRSWQSSFRQTRIKGGLREAPYSIGIFGGTGVGKSSVANILMVTTLLHNGFEASDDRIITVNESDKYFSNFRSFINGVLVDDIGNTKADFVEKAPTTLMIQLINNVRMYANMAEADMKGKVAVQPRVVISTKNVKDSCATVYSNEPASIARRDRITITVKVRDEFCSDGMLDQRKVKAFYGDEVPLIPDLWYIKVEQAFPVKNRTKGAKDTIGWKPVEWNGETLENISIKHLIQFIAADSKVFYEDQEKFVKRSNNLAEKFDLCKECGLVDEICDCCPDDEFSTSSEKEDRVYDNQFGEKIATLVQQKVWKTQRFLAPKFAYWLDEIEDRTVKWMISRLDWLERSPYVVWSNYVPTSWLSHKLFKDLVWMTNETKLKERIRASYLNHILVLIALFVLGIVMHPIYFYAMFFPMLAIGRIVEVEKEKLYDEVSADNRAMPEIFSMYRDAHAKWITGMCVGIAALYGIALVWKQIELVKSPQGNLAPSGDKDIEERDTEVNEWAEVHVSEMPCSDKAKTTSVDDLEKLVYKNMAFMSFVPKGMKKTYECAAFFPCSNVAIVPNHVWLANDMKATFTRHEPNKIGGNFEAWICKEQSYRIPGTDFRMVWVPNGGDWKDLTEYLPKDKFASVPARFVYKNEKGKQLLVKGKTPRLKMETGPARTKAGNFFGASYDLPFNSFTGLCMAALVTETKGPLIGGFHLGGMTGDIEGCCGLLTQSQCQDALECLAKRPSVVLSKSEGEIPTKLYDIQFYEGAEVHPKSAINFLPVGANCKYYGQCTGRATYHSEVEDTVISSDVEDVTGVPQKWGPPKFRVGWPFQASLQYSTKPSLGIEGSLLARASRDYLVPLLQALDALPKMKSEVRPLTEMETVCGIDGRRFVDKMPPNTSVGFPLSGPKSNYLALLDPEDHPTHQHPAELDPIFWKHAYEMEELYLSGKRAYPIFKACLKDEPTKLTKDKVRVFQGAPTALQLLVRKYYLPIARVLSMMPLKSECAVGVNAQGPEWDQLAKHIKHYGENRILAGDYSKYDLRMPAQVMFSAFRIMIEIGRHCGYSERDVTIMEGIASDICYPLMAYNGDLIQHFGSNPSGQNLTVYVNSIVNALLFRCAYYEICKHRMDLPNFNEMCALITYGDDAKSSVHQDFPEFNHIAVAEFLEARDMKFTMPDKESEPTPYMNDEEADLLKRKNIYSSDTGRIMGALDEDSIFKSLHSVLRSKAITKEQQAMQVIDGALREWFSYGREHYEMRRMQMNEIAERANIAHGCTMLHVSYDDQLLTYKEKYKSD